jgi:hypothetical protein
VLLDGGGELAPGLQNVGKKGLSGLINAGVGTIQTREVLDREGAGNVTAGVPAHAIGNHIEVWADRARVLIGRANLPDVGRRRAED